MSDDSDSRSILRRRSGLRASTTPPAHQQDAALVAYLEALHDAGDGLMVTRINFSKLENPLYENSDWATALEAFRNFTSHCGGELFVLSNRDVVFLHDQKYHADAFAAANKVKYIFRGDPLLKRIEADGRERLIDVLRLPEQRQDMLDYAKQHLRVEPKQLFSQLTAMDAPASPLSASSKAALTPTESISGRVLDSTIIGKLEKHMMSLDLRTYIKRTHTALMNQNQEARLVWMNIRLDDALLNERITPTIAWHKTPWLMHHLRDQFDVLLRKLMIHDQKLWPNHPCALSLRLHDTQSASLTSLADVAYRVSQLPLMALISADDIFMNLPRARQQLSKLAASGIRVAIDGLDLRLLPALTTLDLPYHAVIVQPPEIERELDVLRLASGAIRHIGSNRVVMAGIQEHRLIKLCQDFGIMLFQGPLIEKVMQVGGMAH